MCFGNAKVIMHRGAGNHQTCTPIQTISGDSFFGFLPGFNVNLNGLDQWPYIFGKKKCPPDRKIRGLESSSLRRVLKRESFPKKTQSWACDRKTAKLILF